MVDEKLAIAATSVKERRISDATKLYVACGEDVKKILSENQDNPELVEALTPHLE